MFKHSVHFSVIIKNYTMRVVNIIIITILITVFINHDINSQNTGKMELATFGSGCFWCTEAIFEKVKGIESVVSGYSGGKVKNPTYREVCTGNTGHAEVVQITYNPEIIAFKDLLKIFWKMHDPTTLNRQGADVGTQYRSVIFYHTDKQKEIAETYKKRLDEANIYKKPVVTEITFFESFYKAEDYHQEYYENNKFQPYCSFVITPKLEKFKNVFKDKLK